MLRCARAESREAHVAMASSSKELVLASPPTFTYPTSKQARHVSDYIADDVKRGTHQHEIDARILTNEAAWLEFPENVSGQVDPHGTTLHEMPKAVYDASLVQASDGTPMFMAWSSTKLDAGTFQTMFDSRPQPEEANKSHKNSVFNSGMKLAHEKITGGQGDLYVLAQCKFPEGTTEHRLGRCERQPAVSRPCSRQPARRLPIACHMLASIWCVLPRSWQEIGRGAGVEHVQESARTVGRDESLRPRRQAGLPDARVRI